jgi:hypothetical protein
MNTEYMNEKWLIMPALNHVNVEDEFTCRLVK